HPQVPEAGLGRAICLKCSAELALSTQSLSDHASEMSETQRTTRSLKEAERLLVENHRLGESSLRGMMFSEIRKNLSEKGGFARDRRTLPQPLEGRHRFFALACSL